MKRKHLRTLGVVMITLILSACGDKEDESPVRDAVEEVITRDFKMYESTKKSLEEIQKVSDQNREKELDLLK